MDKPVKLRKGTELMKQRGKPGAVRKVARVYADRSPPEILVEWVHETKRDGKEPLAQFLELQPNGLPRGYVLAKDRAAKKAGAK